MNIPHLLIRLQIEIPHFLPTRRAQGLVKVGMQTLPTTGGAIADPVVLIQGFRFFRGLVLVVEIVECGAELVGDAVLLVEFDGLLENLITQRVAVSQVFGGDPGAGFFLLRDRVALVVRVAVRGDVVHF